MPCIRILLIRYSVYYICRYKLIISSRVCETLLYFRINMYNKQEIECHTNVCIKFVLQMNTSSMCCSCKCTCPHITTNTNMYTLMLVHLQAYVCVYKYNIEMFHISMQRYTRLFALQVASSRRSAFVAASDQPLTP